MLKTAEEREGSPLRQLRAKHRDGLSSGGSDRVATQLLAHFARRQAGDPEFQEWAAAHPRYGELCRSLYLALQDGPHADPAYAEDSDG